LESSLPPVGIEDNDIVGTTADRRTFLATSARAIIGASACTQFGCRQATPSTDVAGKRAGLQHLIADLEERIPRLLTAHAVPGCGFVLVRNGEVTWRHGFGLADVASKTPVDNETVFPAESMSKPVFAYAVLKLCETGVLDLDSPLTRYTPERWVSGDPRMDLITARHILSHTSGFQNWRSSAHPLSIDFAPGTRWQYSGEGYSYLQAVVTRLTGHIDSSNCSTFEGDLRVCATDVDASMKARLLVPFGMTSSGYLWDERWASRVARRHDAGGMPLETPHPTAATVARYASSGGLYATATDYARFLIQVIDPKPADTFRLTAASLQMMTRPVIPVADDPRGSSWALGWQVFPTTAGNVIAHGGDGGGSHSFAVASMRHRSAYVLMTNGENGWKLTQQMVTPDEMHRLLTA
jgi:CubicO group peptidase (beta-lactamase class C family)